MTDPRLHERTVSEWRALGFFYDYDQGASCWRFIGSREGLMKFVALLESYASNPRNQQLSEHAHYGPYLYLKLMTWSQPEITDSAISGTLPDLRRLADLVRNKLILSAEVDTFTIGNEYASSISVLTFETKETGFDPASADPLLFSSTLMEPDGGN